MKTHQTVSTDTLAGRILEYTGFNLYQLHDAISEGNTEWTKEIVARITSDLAKLNGALSDSK